MWPDYDLDNPSSWTVMGAPELSSAWTDALTRIGGRNPFGGPMLALRWGATHRDPFALDRGLKYWLCNRERTLDGFSFTDPVTGMELMVKKMDDVPPAVLVAVPVYTPALELGERRWIVEQWRDPDFIAASGRYQDGSTVDVGESMDFPFCRSCHAELPVKPSGEPEPCVCGSKRHYIKTEREDGHGQLLQRGAPEGAYDFFLRLENQLGEPMPADEYALHLIEEMWRRQHAQSRREKLTDMVAETESQALTNLRATSPTNPFIAPTVGGW